MKEGKSEFVLFSDMLQRALRNSEFRSLYEVPDEEDLAIRAFMDARIKAKKLKEDKSQVAPSQRFAV
jgi:hypothetical protein